MAFDACMMRAVISEFKKEFFDAKIEKVYQPRNDEIDLLIHSGKNSGRLVFNVGPNAPRMQLSDKAKENPLKAPMFCMFMRKHFQGARIISVEQPGFDRIAIFTVSAYDEMGFQTERKLVCEIMGKYANLIVLDAEDKIVTALKTVDFSQSTVRQVLPGLKYRFPDKQEKADPLKIDKNLFFEKLSKFPKERSFEKFITSTYSGIATQIARELTYRTSENVNTPVENIDAERAFSVFSDWQELLIREEYNPTVAFDENGLPVDYSYMDITYLRGSLATKNFPRTREMLDVYFAEKDRLERISQRARDLITLLHNATARTERKLEIQRSALYDSERAEEYRREGDLITANLYRLERGMESFTAIDYYDEACPEVTVKLDPRLYPAQNAKKMYKLYNKAKTAKAVLTEQIETWERELIYLDSVKAFLERAESEEDIAEIREELARSGYSSKLKNYTPEKKPKLRELSYTSPSGYKILVGRNNLQNENLTHKIAGKGDLWFHAKDVPGSHVILLVDGEEPPAEDYTAAAEIAAYYSKAGGELVAVDYTRVKNIKKPPASKPGFVTYKTNYTAYVKPRLPEETENG